MTEEVKMKYPSNELDSFQVGLLMDFRVKIALELIKAPSFNLYHSSARDSTAFALELANELMSQAAELGWIEPLDDEAKLSERAKKHARRTGAFQVNQQLGANEEAADAQSRVVPAAPVINRPTH